MNLHHSLEIPIELRKATNVKLLKAEQAVSSRGLRDADGARAEQSLFLPYRFFGLLIGYSPDLNL